MRQLDLFGEHPGSHSVLVKDALAALSSHGDSERRGAIFTRPEVVDFILDLSGYTENRPLSAKRLLEPIGYGGYARLSFRGDRLSRHHHHQP